MLLKSTKELYHTENIYYVKHRAVHKHKRVKHMLVASISINKILAKLFSVKKLAACFFYDKKKQASSQINR